MSEALEDRYTDIEGKCTCEDKEEEEESNVHDRE
jgi:hypothetical protein